MPKIDKRKIYVYDVNGELVKVCKNKESAANFANTSTSSVIRSLKGLSKSSHCGYWFRWEEDNNGLHFKNPKAIVKKDKDGNILKKYYSMSQASQETGISVSSISYLIKGKMNKENFIQRYGFYFDLYEEKQEVKEVETKPKRQEYFINILVGLVNGTLIDGATYIVNNIRFVYNKNEQSLIADGNIKIKRDSYITLCDIEKPLLTAKEKEFIAMLKGNMSIIKTITKLKNYNGMEYVMLKGDNDFYLILDEFKEGTQYTGLKLNQIYELDKLGVKTT